MQQRKHRRGYAAETVVVRFGVDTVVISRFGDAHIEIDRLQDQVEKPIIDVDGWPVGQRDPRSTVHEFGAPSA